MKLSAFNGIFTMSQLQDIKSMSKVAYGMGVTLHSLLETEAPTYKNQVIKNAFTKEANGNGFVKKPIRTCPGCGGKLKVFSLNKKELKEHPGMMSKWECCKTCSSKSKPCGYIEYNQKTVEQIIKEAGNDSSQ